MVTTHVDHVKKKPVELAAAAKEYHHPPSYYHDVDNHSLPFEEVKCCFFEQAIQLFYDRNCPMAKAWVEMNLNPPPPFESDDDGEDEVHGSRDKAVDPVPRKNET
jgi:hypothetical protein